MMSNGRMVKSLKLKLRIFGALAGMTSLLITLLPTYVQAETWTEDSDPNNYVMEDLPLSGGGTGTVVTEYKGTATVLKIPAQLGSKTVVLQPGFKLSDTVEKLNVSMVKPKDPADISKLFAGCPKVKQIIFHVDGTSNTFDTAAVTNMSGLFEGCAALTSVDLGSLNTQAVTNMSGMFKGCKELQTLGLLGSFDTAHVTDMREMFRDCEKLSVLDLSNFDLSGITAEANIADFLTGTKPSTIKSPKTNPLEDKIALPVSDSVYYKDVANKKLTMLPKTTGTSLELTRVVEVTSLILDPTKIELQMGDTRELKATILPNEATNKGLKWEVLDSSTMVASDDICEVTPDPTDPTKRTLKAKKDGKATVKVSSLSNPDKAVICEVTVKPGYHAGVKDDRSDTPGGYVSAATAEGEGFAVSVSSGATEMQKAVESGQSYKNPYMVSYFNLKVTKNGNPVSKSDFQPVTVTIPLPQSMNALVAKAKPTLLRLDGNRQTFHEEQAAVIRQEAGGLYSITFTLKKGDQTDPETQYALIYKTNPDGSANGSSGSSNSASGTSGAIIVNVSPTPITVNVQAGSSSSANSSNSSSNGSSNGSVIIYQNPNGINGGNVIRTLGGGGINGMDMPKTADSMSVRYRTLGAMIMALLGALLFLSSFLVGGFGGRKPVLAASTESRQKRRFAADEDSRWLE